MRAYRLTWILYSLIYGTKFQDIIGLQEKVFRLLIIELETVGFQMESDWNTNVIEGNKSIWDLGGGSHTFG